MRQPVFRRNPAAFVTEPVTAPWHQRLVNSAGTRAKTVLDRIALGVRQSHRNIPSRAPFDWSDCLLVLCIEGRPQSLHFYPYSECIGPGSLIEWTVQRVRSATDRKSEICVLLGKADESRLKTALEYQPRPRLSLLSGLGQLHDLKLLASVTKKPLLLLIDVTAALLPLDIFETLRRHHTTQQNDATSLAGLPCASQPLLIESSLVSALAAVPGLSQDVRMALDEVLRSTLLRAKLLRVSAGHLRPISATGQALRRWPYAVQLQRPDDIAILRLALQLRGSIERPGSSECPLDTWSAASWRFREERLEELPRRIASSTTTSSCGPRVLYVQTPSAFSGVEQVLLLLAQSIKQTPTTPINCVALIAERGTLTARLVDAGIDVRVAERDFGRSSFESYLYSCGELDAINPAIVHAHAFVGVPFCCAVAERLLPFIQHVHVASERGLGTLTDQLTFATHVVAVSAFVKRQLTRLGIDPEKIQIIRNGTVVSSVGPRDVRARTVARKQFGLTDNAKVILLPARFAPNKRHDVLIDALASVRNQLPDVYLLLAGDVFPRDQQLFEAVERRISRLRLRDRVRCLAFCSDMASVYAAADLLVLPSEDDPLPMTILEAMAAWVPVVAANSGGIPEMVTDGVTGLLVEPGNPDGFAKAISRVFCDAELRDRLAAGGFARCQAEFSLSKFVGEVTSLYAGALSGVSVNTVEYGRRP